MSRNWRRWLPLVMLSAWIALIVATSNTVVRRREFFAWFGKHVFQDETNFERFQTFWRFAWIPIVKGWHATEFALLMLLFVAALTTITGRCTNRLVILSGICCFAFAISDEWHQSFVRDRFGTLTDVLVDTFGIVVAGSLILLRIHLRDRRTV